MTHRPSPTFNHAKRAPAFRQVFLRRSDWTNWQVIQCSIGQAECLVSLFYPHHEPRPNITSTEDRYSDREISVGSEGVIASYIPVNPARPGRHSDHLHIASCLIRQYASIMHP